MTTHDASKSERLRTIGARDGVQGEWIALPKVIPGHEEAIREIMRSTPEKDELRHQAVDSVQTVHNYRGALLDNGTRFLFASVYDGPWDTYIDDFGADPFFKVAFDELLQHTEGYKGWQHPDNKDWLLANSVSAEYFISAYPELTTRQVWKLQRLGEAFQALLDSPEFQAALKNPAHADLLNTPAFQKVLDEAAS